MADACEKKEEYTHIHAPCDISLPDSHPHPYPCIFCSAFL